MLQMIYTSDNTVSLSFRRRDDARVGVLIILVIAFLVEIPADSLSLSWALAIALRDLDFRLIQVIIVYTAIPSVQFTL